MFEQYQDKAAIPEDAAMDCFSREQTHFDIEEIIFEHPDLELCRHGVEIVDSPGLNENPDRTAITQKLLKDTDAAIFLTNASRSLTQGERDLLQGLRTQLNGGKDEPADNLFIVGNFMDLVRTEKDRHQVQQRIERFVQGQNPITAGENRVHFISAQAALDAILKGSENEYLKTFQNFTQSLEKFLAIERGSLEIKQYVTKIKVVIQAFLHALDQSEQVLDEKIKFSEAEKQKILEHIGEASGRDVRIFLVAEQLVDEVIEQVNESWSVWMEGVAERLAEKVARWSSVHSAFFSRDQLAKDYANQFTTDLSAELDGWIENQLKKDILKPNLEILKEKIRQELQLIKIDVNNVNQTDTHKSPDWVFYGENHNFDVSLSILDNVGLAGLGAAVLIPAIVFAGPILAVIGMVCGGGLLGGGIGGLLGLDAEIRAKAFESGYQQFEDSIEKVFEQINETIGYAFSEQIALADEVIFKAISIYENLLEQQEQANQKTLKRVWLQFDVKIQPVATC